MAIQRLAIKEFLQPSKNRVLLDVRSPGEYKHAHIPSARSFPLFTDEERRVVGTTYKQKSREEAIKIGLDFFAPKMRKMVEAVEALSNDNRSGIQNFRPEIFLYCWRGGMRSAAVAWLLDLYGFKVSTLAGGYKSFRNHVLRTFEQPFQFKILGGYTGSGKTETLHQLERLGETIIDLENIASHKGSAFGGFKMPPQPTQEMFENILASELQEKWGTNGDLESTTQHSIWLEDEAQRIGDLNLPNTLWATMRNSPVMFLEIPFEERLNHIIDEYGECDLQTLIESTRRISQRLGGLDAKNAIQHLENGNTREAFHILLRYYDKHYLRGLHNRQNLSALLTTVECKTVASNNALKLTKPQPA